jgi:beta-mannanase
MTRPPIVGAYAGSDRRAVARADATERWLGDSLDVQHVFTPWDVREDAVSYLFEELLPAIWAAGRVPLVTWEPFTPAPESTPPDVAERIAAGAYDEYVRQWAERLESWVRGPDGVPGTGDDRRLYLRFAHEANGDWYPWCPAGDAAPYVAMWRRVRDAFGEFALDGRVRWLWAVNHVDVGPSGIESVFPGDAYVDRVAVDGFNWGATRDWSAWRSPKAVFEDALDRVEALTDAPACVAEVGCTARTEAGVDPDRKNDWIADAFEYFAGRDVDAVCWFDVDKETDWAVFGGERGLDRWTDDADGRTYRVYPSFRRAVRDGER